MPEGPEQKNENKMKEKDLVKLWQENIKAGVRYRTVYGKAKEWLQYKNMLRGFWGAGVIPVNLLHSIGRSLVTQIAPQNPRMYVNPRKPGYTPQAMVIERLDNRLIKETGLKRQVKRCILDSFLCGVGPVVIGYDSEFGHHPKYTVDSMMKDSGLTAFSDEGRIIEYNDDVNPGMPWTLRCSPNDFIVPWGSLSIESSRWFAFRTMRPKQDVVEDPKYYSWVKDIKAPFSTRLEGTKSGNSDDKPQWLEEDGNNKWCEIWEVHDKRTRMVYNLTLDDPKFLRAEEDELQFGNSLPTEVLGFNDDPDFFWLTPDARLMQMQQAEINDIRTMAKKHRRAALLKMIVDKTAFQPDEVAKLLDDDIKGAVRADVGPTGDIRKAVLLLQSHIPPDLAAAAEEVREDLKDIVGMSQNQQGNFEAPAGRRTAHEAEIVQAMSMARVGERKEVVNDFIISIMKKQNAVVFDNWNDSRIIDVVGNDGKRYWVRYTGQDLKGQFDYEYQPEEKSPSNQLVRRQEIQNFLDMATKLPGMNIPYLIQQYARQFDWLDPKMLMPQSGTAGRSPENAMGFNQFQRMVGGQTPEMQNKLSYQMQTPDLDQETSEQR